MKQYIGDDDDDDGWRNGKEREGKETHAHAHTHARMHARTQQVFSPMYRLCPHIILYHSSICCSIASTTKRKISVTISTSVAVIEHDGNDTMLLLLLLLLLLHDAPFSSLCCV